MRDEVDGSKGIHRGRGGTGEGRDGQCSLKRESREDIVGEAGEKQCGEVPQWRYMYSRNIIIYYRNFKEA